MYEKIEVWRRSENKEAVHVFLCFRDLETDKFHVQSVDWYYPDSDESSMKSLRKNRVELFIEQDIKERAQGYDSLREAIEAAIEDYDVS